MKELRLAALGAVLLVVGCGADKDKGPTGSNTQAACAARDPGPSPVRRLTRFEYDNTIRDLLGDDSHPSAAFPPDETAEGFDNNAEVLGVTDLLAEQYLDVAEQLAGRAVASATVMAGITPCVTTDADCARSFIQSFGRRAWRRPLTDDEQNRLAAVFADAAADGFPAAAQTVIEVMLQSPQFLYRVEVGVPAADRPGWMKLTPWETASRLSFLILGSTPDNDLLDKAAAGGLDTADQVATEARRMLGDARARAVVANFNRQWLELDKLNDLEKDLTTFPTWQDGLPDLMRTEVNDLLDSIIWDGDGKVSTLLTAPYTYVNPQLAKFYGMAAPAGSGFQRVELDPNQRAGFLTQGAFLATHAKPNQTSPVHRGKFVRTQLFCTVPPPPPPNLQIQPPSLNPRLSTRERFAEHSQNAFCASCHKLMDPIGLGFESFDGVGRARTMENGIPIDDSGEIIGTDVDGTFTGAAALGQRLAASAEVQSCVVTQWFRYGYGRAEDPAGDACSLATLGDKFAATGGNVRELLIALTQTDAFLYRRAEDTQ